MCLVEASILSYKPLWLIQSRGWRIHFSYKFLFQTQSFGTLGFIPRGWEMSIRPERKRLNWWPTFSEDMTSAVPEPKNKCKLKVRRRDERNIGTSLVRPLGMWHESVFRPHPSSYKNALIKSLYFWNRTGDSASDSNVYRICSENAEPYNGYSVKVKYDLVAHDHERHACRWVAWPFSTLLTSCP